MSTLPFTTQFQKMALGHIWRTKGALGAYSDIFQPMFFRESGLATLCQTLFTHYNTYKAAPSHIAVQELIRDQYPDENRDDQNKQRNILLRLARECQEMELDDPAFIDSKIRNFMGWSAVRDAVAETAEDLREGKYDPQVVEKFQKAVNVGSVTLTRGTSLRDDTLRIIDEETNPNHRKRIPTGMIHFDTELGGGLRGGELGVLMGPPKGFKSGTLLNIGFSGCTWFSSQFVLLNGKIKKVLYITLELSEELQIMRHAYRTTGIEKAVMRENPAKFKEVFTAKSDALFPNGDVEIKFFPPYVCTPNTIRRYLDQSREMGIEYGLIIIDYLDLMGSDRKMKDDYLEKVIITTDVRQIAKDYDVPVWTACRTTREAAGKKFISAQHMSGAFERVAIADYVYALCQTMDERANGKLRLVPVANRNESGMRVICCNFRPSVMALESMESQEMDEEDFEAGLDDFKQQKKKSKKKFDEAMIDLSLDE